MSRGCDEPYRAEGLVLRDSGTKELQTVKPEEFSAIQAVPDFAARWAKDAATQFGNNKVLTATINASGACPIGNEALCGQYCFAHRSWSPDLSPRRDIADKYVADARQLMAKGKEVGIFMSYDTEPFPGGVVSEISTRILRAMVDNPPAALLVHSHTANIGNREVAAVLKDVSQATDLIVGIGFETDSEDTGEGNRPHHHSIENRFKAFESLADIGIHMQASTTPLLGFRDFPGFVRRFHNAGAYRIMTGELRKKFDIGGDTRARELKIGLPTPTEEEALAVCRDYNFPGGANVREVFYVTMS